MMFCDALPGGQSLGKRCLKISVVDTSSEDPCKVWQSFIRNLSLMLLGVFDIIFIIGSQKRRLGDYMAHTKVIDVTLHMPIVEK